MIEWLLIVVIIASALALARCAGLVRETPQCSAGSVAHLFTDCTAPRR